MLGTSDTHHAANNLIFALMTDLLAKRDLPPTQPRAPMGTVSGYWFIGHVRFDPRRHTIARTEATAPTRTGLPSTTGIPLRNGWNGGRSYSPPRGEGWKMHGILSKGPPRACLRNFERELPRRDAGRFPNLQLIGFLGIKQYKLHRDGFEKTKTVGRTQDAKKVVEKTKVGEVWGTPNGERLKVTKTRQRKQAR